MDNGDLRYNGQVWLEVIVDYIFSATLCPTERIDYQQKFEVSNKAIHRFIRIGIRNAMNANNANSVDKGPKYGYSNDNKHIRIYIIQILQCVRQQFCTLRYLGAAASEVRESFE